MTERSGRLEVGIIGAGRVGPILGRALAGAGHFVTAINAVSEEARERAETLLPNVDVVHPDEVIRRTQLVILAVPGDELEDLINGLTEADAWQPGQIVLHTSPNHGYGILTPAVTRGVIPIAFHPAMVFTGTSLDLTRLHEATVAVSAPTPVLPIAQALAVEIGAEPVVIEESDRAAYADAIDALTSLTRAVVTQALDSLREINPAHVSRTVGSIARAVIEEALTENE